MRTMAAVALAGLVLALAACGQAPSGTGYGGTSPTKGPGIMNGTGGRSEAYGWVVRSGLEGGFWALSRSKASSEASDVVAVLLPGKTGEAAIEALDGSYVRVSGTVSRGVSIRMAGPEITVDSIERAEAP